MSHCSPSLSYRLGASLRRVHWRPRFTLRSLLVVVTLLCLALGYQLNWIRQRRAVIAGGEVTAIPLLDPSGIAPEPPGLLRFFGERGETLLIIHSRSNADWLEQEKRLAALFPEAEIRRHVADPVFDGNGRSMQVR